MPMKYLLFVILLQGECGFITSAQEAKQEQPAKKGCSCAFSSIIQAGALAGVKGTEALIQTVNGIRLHTWYIGVGIGLDHYSIKAFLHKKYRPENRGQGSVGLFRPLLMQVLVYLSDFCCKGY